MYGSYSQDEVRRKSRHASNQGMAAAQLPDMVKSGGRGGGGELACCDVCCHVDLLELLQGQ